MQTKLYIWTFGNPYNLLIHFNIQCQPCNLQFAGFKKRSLLCHYLRERLCFLSKMCELIVFKSNLINICFSWYLFEKVWGSLRMYEKVWAIMRKYEQILESMRMYAKVCESTVIFDILEPYHYFNFRIFTLLFVSLFTKFCI